MLCDICHSKPARILYTEIVNGERREKHLCEDCAGAYASSSIKDKLGNDIPLGSLLSGILSTYAKEAVSSSMDQKRCSGCGITFEQFRKSGRLGCPLCYETFGGIIDKNLKNIQGANRHSGKQPVNGEAPKPVANGFTASETDGSDGDDSVSAAAAVIAGFKPSAGKGGGDGIEELKRKMDEAVRVEDYEEAARLRDLIKSKKSSEPSDGGKA